MLSSDMVFEWEGYRGPTPPPALIDGYQQAIPNGGERVMDMAEREQDHRHSMEQQQLSRSFQAHVIGIVAGTVVALAVIVLGAWLISDGHGVAGFGTLLVGAAGLVRAALRRAR